MCFVLYAATTRPIPRRKWDLGSPDLPVESLTEHDASVKKHFSNPEVQYIGSTNGCGCDFPHVMFQSGGWPHFESPAADAQQSVCDRLNREGLVNLLASTGDSTVELYGIWDGDFAEAPTSREDISLETILKHDFHLKERGFYRVLIP